MVKEKVEVERLTRQKGGWLSALIPEQSFHFLENTENSVKKETRQAVDQKLSLLRLAAAQYCPVPSITRVQAPTGVMSLTRSNWISSGFSLPGLKITRRGLIATNQSYRSRCRMGLT